jgi:hypothetical protein
LHVENAVDLMKSPEFLIDLFNQLEPGAGYGDKFAKAAGGNIELVKLYWKLESFKR